MNILAKVISFVFHPLLVPTYLITLLGYFFPLAVYPINPQAFPNFLKLIFFMTFLLPALNILLFRMTRTISSLKMEMRKERIRPFFLIVILYGAMTYLIHTRIHISLDDSLMKFLLIINFLVISSFLITLFYKVSVHSLAMTGLLGIILPLTKVSEDGLLFFPFLICIVLTGAVMSARLYLGAHTSHEVYIGGIVGFIISFGSMIILF